MADDPTQQPDDNNRTHTYSLIWQELVSWRIGTGPRK
jgi:hypothetical protein